MYFSTLFSGSSGNALYIETEESSILVDAGLSSVKIQRALEAIGRSAGELDAILVTHEHRDHICGVGVLSRRFDLPIYATENTWSAMEADIGKIADTNHACLELDRTLEIGDLNIDFFATSHDAVDPCGFIFSQGKERLGLLTDTGCLTAVMEPVLTGCQSLILESNHDLDMLARGPYPWYLKQRIRSCKGHLSNDDAGEAIRRFVTGDTTRVVLAHLSEENNLPRLALQNAAEVLAEIDCDSVRLSAASRYEPMPLTAVGEE